MDTAPDRGHAGAVSAFQPTQPDLDIAWFTDPAGNVLSVVRQG